MARGVLSILLLLALALAACGGDDDGDDGATFESGPAVATAEPATLTPTPTVTPTPTPTADPLAALDLPRQLVYAHMVFEFTSAQISDVTPNSYGREDERRGETPYLYLDFTVEFEQGYPGRTEEMNVADWRLHLSDGSVVSSEEVRAARRILIQPPDPREHSFAFDVVGHDLAGAVLTFDNGENIPAALPLDGPVPADPYPIRVSIDDDSKVEYEGGCFPAPGQVQLIDAEWDIDGGVDLDGGAMVRAGTTRAANGELFVRIHVEVTADDGNCGGTVMSPKMFRMNTGTGYLEPLNIFIRELDDGEKAEIVWGFRVPVGSVPSLEVGWEEGQTATFEIPGP